MKRAIFSPHIEDLIQKIRKISGYDIQVHSERDLSRDCTLITVQLSAPGRSDHDKFRTAIDLAGIISGATDKAMIPAFRRWLELERHLDTDARLTDKGIITLMDSHLHDPEVSFDFDGWEKDKSTKKEEPIKEYGMGW